MKRLTLAAVAVSAIALSPLPAFASEEPGEVEKECREAAMEKGVAAEEIADYIADCVGKNMSEDEGEGAEEKEEAAESMTSE